MSKFRIFNVLITIFAASLLMTVAKGTVAADKPGTKDHPLFSRYAEVEIRDREDRAFDRYERSAVTCDPKNCKHPNFNANGFSAEGKITTITYQTPNFTKISLLQALRNYQEAVKTLGGVWLNPSERPNEYHVFAIPSVKDNAKSPPIFLTLNFTYSADKYELTVIEPVALVQSVKAGELTKEILSKGTATLYINFATNKFDLPAEANPIVKELSELLAKQPTLRLSIEGHTDNVGQAKDNQSLSANRAESLMKALIAQGVNKSKLKSSGFGSTVPIADNRNYEGRGKNRRVEIIKF